MTYEISTPELGRVRVRFGETERGFDKASWAQLPAEQQRANPPPAITYSWRREFSQPQSADDAVERAGLVQSHAVYLTDVPEQVLRRAKEELSDRVGASRSGEAGLRIRLRALFRMDRELPESFDRRDEDWREGYDFLGTQAESAGMAVDVFSVAGDGGNRVSAFLMSEAVSLDARKPALLMLSGNPPGTKESLVSGAVFFARLGYHVIGMDRRPECLRLDKKEKFLTNYSEPVFDAVRLLDFLETQSVAKIDGIGLYGFSAGAGEARLVAALDDRVRAVVLACGITSHDWLFRERAWIPTYSGMIVYPELGLGSVDVGNLSSREYWANYERVTPEHTARARAVFTQLFPYFEDLDSTAVVPLIAPVPVLMITGAQDDQFGIPGVVQVDRFAREAYARHGLGHACELYVQPRAGHSVTWKSGLVAAAFFQRWLQ